MSDNEIQFFGVMEMNEKQEWYAKLKALPAIRDFELKEWEEWANFHFNQQKEKNND